MSAAIDLGGIDWIRLSFVDVFGRSHSMQLPASRFPEASRTARRSTARRPLGYREQVTPWEVERYLDEA